MARGEFVGAVVCAVLAASLAACQPATDTDKIADAVKLDTAQLVGDFNAHDGARLASHDAADVVEMFHGSPNTVGVAAELKLNRQYFAANPDAHLSVTAQSVDVSASGDMAVLHSQYVLTVNDPTTGKAITETGNYTAGYKPQPDGSWKIEWQVISDAPASPGAKR